MLCWSFHGLEFLFIQKENFRLLQELLFLVHLDFLLIYQQGKLKAKVPVVKMEVFETNKPKQEKITSSFSAYIFTLRKRYSRAKTRIEKRR